jgi:nucleoid-associated protein YgaU
METESAAVEEPAPAEPEMIAEAAPEEEPMAAPKVGVAAVEADATGGLFVAGTAEEKHTIRVYVDDEFVGEAQPSEAGTWLVEARRDMPEGTYTVRADQVEAGTGTVIARAEVPFQREIAVAVAVTSAADATPAVTVEAVTEAAVADVVAKEEIVAEEDMPAASGGTGTETEVAVAAVAAKSGPETVIIKRGDNLWNLARDIYGQGLRFSTIYQANREQIRNPHWIYPGQVFVVPGEGAN